MWWWYICAGVVWEGAPFFSLSRAWFPLAPMFHCRSGSGVLLSWDWVFLSFQKEKKNKTNLWFGLSPWPLFVEPCVDLDPFLVVTCFCIFFYDFKLLYQEFPFVPVDCIPWTKFLWRLLVLGQARTRLLHPFKGVSVFFKYIAFIMYINIMYIYVHSERYVARKSKMTYNLE